MRLDLCRTGSEFKSHHQSYLWCYEEHSICNDPSLHQADHCLKCYSSASTFSKIHYIIMEAYLVTILDFRSVFYRRNRFDAKNSSSLKYRIANLLTTKKLLADRNDCQEKYALNFYRYDIQQTLMAC